jgi:ubiquinone biosynthesis protein
MYFAARHGERLATELGLEAASVDFDFDSVKAGFGVENHVESLTYRELQERRQIIQKRMRSHHRG